MDSWQTAVGLLQLAGRLTEGVQAGLARRGFDDVRPAHGFAFVRMSSGDATTADVAEHLGITKQAASQLVGYLVERGYVTRTADPADRRARRLLLTARGRACTVAAEAAAAETVEVWRAILEPASFAALQSAVAALAAADTGGRLRPAW